MSAHVLLNLLNEFTNLIISIIQAHENQILFITGH